MMNLEELLRREGQRRVQTPFGALMEHLGVTRPDIVDFLEKLQFSAGPQRDPNALRLQRPIAELLGGMVPLDVSPGEMVLNTTPFGMGKVLGGRQFVEAPSFRMIGEGYKPEMMTGLNIRNKYLPELKERASFGGELSPEGKRILGWFDRHRGESAVHFNSKTGMSVDFSTNCPKKLDPSKGPCPYCYVEHGRTSQKLYNMQGGSKAVSDNPYRGEVRTFPEDLVKELNSDGGLRMFSFGDFRPGVDDVSVNGLLGDARQKGLFLKAITKQPEFVQRFADHPNLRVNISVDNVPREISVNAPSIDQAVQLKGKRENVKIRAVALNPQEAEMFARDPRVDVVTLYHGLTNFASDGTRHNKLLNIIMEQNPKLVDRVGLEALQRYTDTWVNMKAPKIFDRMVEKYPRKICCQGGKCSRDKTKCGFGYGSLLLAGILLPEIDVESVE